LVDLKTKFSGEIDVGT